MPTGSAYSALTPLATKWIRKSQVDPVHGGWWATVRADGTPISRVKADMWTECYHQGRAMLVVSERLRRLASK